MYTLTIQTDFDFVVSSGPKLFYGTFKIASPSWSNIVNFIKNISTTEEAKDPKKFIENLKDRVDSGPFYISYGNWYAELKEETYDLII